MVEARAGELTSEQSWFLANLLGLGSFPWVLGVRPPYADRALAHSFDARLRAELTATRMLDGDGPSACVARWMRTVCRARRRLELRCLDGSPTTLRGVLARDGARTVLALRRGTLLTFCDVDVVHPDVLVPMLTVGLDDTPPATFERFRLPARVGAWADARVRDGAAPADVMEQVGIPAAARCVVEAAYAPDRRSVEIVAVDEHDGRRHRSEVGVGVVDTARGRVVVTPDRAVDGEWISTFAPGTTFAIAAALVALTATLPEGTWFPTVALTKDFGPRGGRR